MIDTVKPYYFMTNQIINALQSGVVFGISGIKIYGNVFFVKHPYGLQNLKVYFSIEKRLMWFETSLPKLLQGQNVFGSNRLEYMCLKAMEYVYQQVGLNFSAAEREVIRSKGIRLGRVDATCSFLLNSQEEVADALEAILEQLRAEGFKWSAYGEFGIQTLYRQQYSKRITDKFYNKGQELLVNTIPRNVVERERILEIAKNDVRFEVTVRGKELKELNLQYADQWGKKAVRELIEQRLASFKFRGLIKQQLASEQICDLPDGARMFYGLWRQGACFRMSRGYRTLSRARDLLLKTYQVDIYRPRRPRKLISLQRVLAAESAYFVAPKCLTNRGAIFGVGSHRC